MSHIGSYRENNNSYLSVYSMPVGEDKNEYFLRNSCVDKLFKSSDQLNHQSSKNQSFAFVGKKIEVLHSNSSSALFKLKRVFIATFKLFIAIAKLFQSIPSQVHRLYIDWNVVKLNPHLSGEGFKEEYLLAIPMHVE